MRIHSVEVIPRGEMGWGSGELVLGSQLTSLHAPNGSGKTPIVMMVVYALGYPATFRDDISSKCQSVRLKITHGEGSYTIERIIDKDFFATINTDDGEHYEYNNEKAFSNFLFEKAKLQIPTLTSTKGLPTQPYMATTLPIFYLDQDSGYTTPYATSSAFITNQFVETVRFIFGFPPKNSYDRKKEQLKLKAELDSIDRKVVTQEQTIQNLRSDFGVIPDARDLQRKISSLENQLQEFEKSTVQKEEADSALSSMHAEKLQTVQVIEREISLLRDRLTGIDRIKNEIAAEADTLSLNEEARRIFTSFSEICASEKCCLFEKSFQAYAKNLLYLKDQIKDLDRNADIAQQRIAFLDGQHAALKSEARSISESLQKTQEKGRTTGVVEAIRLLTIEHIEAEKLFAKVLAFHGQIEQYNKLITSRDELQDRLGLLETGGATDLTFSKFKVTLKEKIVKWMDILKTPNVSRNVTIENDLDIRFGKEPLSIIKGSTKIRLVLSIHAALFEINLEKPDAPFRFLIMDTPKQHEIHTDDLLHFLSELSQLAAEKDGQIMVSSTDFKYPCGDMDREWRPAFNGPEQAMYLGTREAATLE
ncbi:hypothetical protein MIZ01_1931 [Sideroxyarcus emersonii]|uniref:Rad50/SbcC-type AAA domain-containing protein n=1 Tax=Sideroxyarcus emersonii TaxID=2764705 RepID=A0AAN1XAV5_9PROT|nr:hypothetical protein [Sideroxyarcus emersonii]BCK88130.1 hypothetical protein MIZ01_1931 [Sideroxyarcus emersonii]